MPYRVAIIGCGRMACTIDDESSSRLRQTGLVLPRCHASGYVAVEDTELVAACDIDSERLHVARERWHIPRGYQDYRECIIAEQPDLISVTTRPENHAEIIVFAVAHGVKGLFVEKPLCCSLAETDAIGAACERHGVQLEFGPMRRNWAAFQQARTLAASRDLGPVRSVIAFGGNPCGGHLLDTALYLLGDPEPAGVQATLGQLSPHEGDTANMRFKPDAPIQVARTTFENGMALYVCGTGASGEYGEYELVCEAGRIRIVNDGAALQVRRFMEEARAFEEVAIAPIAHWNGTVHKVRDLVQAVQTGQPGVSNLRATIIGQEIGYAMYESHLQGGTEVSVPIANRERWVSSW